MKRVDEKRGWERFIFLMCGIAVGLFTYAFFLCPKEAEARYGNGCTTQTRSVVVDLDNQKHRRVLRHVWTAVRHGHPRILHIDRVEADANRAAAVQGTPTKPGFDRDEYPPAMSDEGGANSTVWYVDVSQNRSAGAVMGNQLEPFCNGQRFRFERRPR